jgi:beta-phosphoglucomutase-like phosphatase (HAD superfamily)
MNPRRFSLVIFDWDGVLVDSELITNRIFASMLNELGIPVTLD